MSSIHVTMSERMNSGDKSLNLSQNPNRGVVGGNDFNLSGLQLKKEPKDFTSGLKLPKINSGMSQFRPPFEENDIYQQKQIKRTPHTKVRVFKDTRKSEILDRIVSTTPAAVAQLNPTGLFRAKFLSSSESEEGSDHGESIDIGRKVQGFISRRKENKVDGEMRSRISKAFDKMEVLEKGVRSFDDTLLLAKNRLVDSDRKNKTIFAHSTSPRNFMSMNDASKHGSSLGRSRKNSKSRKPVQKMFGLDVMKVVESSDDDDYMEGNELKKTDSVTSPSVRSVHAHTNISMRTKNLNQDFRKNHIPDIRLLARLQRRESKVSQELEDMRNKIEVMNMKSEREERQTKSQRSKVESLYTTGVGNLTRLMSYDAKQGPSKELSDFLQSHGGSTGGWDKEDHDIFLTVYMKWKHKPSEIIRNVSTRCPERKLQEVASHLEWFERYENLNTANKAHIRQWQIKKRRERQLMYKMGKEDSKAQIEGEKSRQEMIRAKREVEREREKTKLNDWKKSKKAEVKKMNVQNDLLREPDGPARTAKLDEQIQLAKERLVKLLPQDLKVRKILTRSKSLSSINKIEMKLNPELITDSGLETSGKDSVSLSSGLLTPSSGILSEPITEGIEGNGDGNSLTLMDRTINEVKQLDLVFPSEETPNDGVTKVLEKLNIEESNFVTSILTPTNPTSHVPKRGGSKKMLDLYRARDDEMIATKRLAIQRKKDNEKNKAFLSTEEAKKRISEINLPSQVAQMTVGARLRHNIRQLEAVENSNRQEAAKNEKEKHRIARVPSPKMFQTGPTLRSISKLGTPSWRSA